MLLFHKETTGYIERKGETPEPSSRTLPYQILCSWLWHVLSLCITSSPSALAPASITQPLASVYVQKSVPFSESSQAHVGLGVYQLHLSQSLHLVPGTRVPATAANKSAEQAHWCLLLDSPVSGKRSEIGRVQGWGSSCSTRPSQGAPRNMLCCLNAYRSSGDQQGLSRVNNLGQVWPNEITLFDSALCRLLSGSWACTHASCLVHESLFLLLFNICTEFVISRIWYAVICYFRIISGSWKKFLPPAGFHLSCHAFCCHFWFPGDI